MRPGVQILIDQLASNPEHFFGPLGEDNALRLRSPKFAYQRHAIERELLDLRPMEGEEVRPKGLGVLWFLTEEERAALLAAFTEARRLRFDAEIIARLHQQEEPEPKYEHKAYPHTISTYGNAIPRVEGSSV